MSTNSEHGTSGEEQSDFEADFDVEEDFSVEGNEPEGAEAIAGQLRTSVLTDDDDDDDDDDNPYSGEPLADKEWLRNYNLRRARAQEQESFLNERFNGSAAASSWCKCGHCSVQHFTKPKECSCCTEIERCAVALNDESVVQEVGSVPTCITEHPAFRPLCLERWSLKYAADRYKTKFHRRYRQTNSESRYSSFYQKMCK
eukprot:Seg5447.1 transcript_id=Seg5447.1/GoldUCD/mRNA.D3Y31 product="hypothetical protein" protein_id=Seg5447.1/GoldUCD/D3Y31